MLALNEQRVRLYCCVQLGFVFDDQCSRIYEAASCDFTSRVILLSEYTASRVQKMLITAVHRSSLLIECMTERVRYWSWTNSAYVCIVMYELELEVVIMQ